MTQNPPGAYHPQPQPHDTPAPHDHDPLQDPRYAGGLMALIVIALVIGAVVWWLFFTDPGDETTATTNPVTTVTTVTTVEGIG